MLIGSWLIHTVTRKRRTGINASGDPSYGSTSTIAARVEFKTRMVKDASGKEIVSTCEMAVLDRPNLDDMFWLPAIAGSTADDTSSDDAARTPVAITGATNKLGTQQLWMVFFG